MKRAAELMTRGDWQAAHEIVQQDEASPLACWAHGIVHIMEGDLTNASYWYRQAKRPFPDAPSIETELAAFRKEIGL
ncbi:MAG: hypothetical protein ACT4P4_03700 [Betaproteobacteria bacterium]